MSNNEFKFNPVNAEQTNKEKKLVIERLPEFMQTSEQIQKFMSDVIQPWFTPEDQKLVDGYIGDRATSAAYGKIFVPEINTERMEYQLSPTYVCRNESAEIKYMQFYDDLIDQLQHNGCLTENQSRLLSGNLYSWTPPINPNKILNYSNYFWDLQNEFGIQPDYIVMQRGALNGNLWSYQNYWYTIGDRLPDGTILDEQVARSSRFARCAAPIIEYIKDIELTNYGKRFRTVVDLLADSTQPEDIVLKRVEDNIRVDGILLKENDRILFTGIGNPGENNRVYKVSIKSMDDGALVYGLTLDEREYSTLRPTGEPLEGDVVLVKNGNRYRNTNMYWKVNRWVEAQKKIGVNQFPSFVLYDINGVELNDPIKYPSSTFKGSNIFGFKINYDYSMDKVYGMHIEKTRYNYYVFENFLQSVKYEYVKSGKTTTIPGLYFFNIITEDTAGKLVDNITSDWVRSEELSRQYVRKVIVPEVKSTVQVVSSLYDLNNIVEPFEGLTVYVLENTRSYVYQSGVWNETANVITSRETYEREYALSQKVTPNTSDELEVRISDRFIPTSQYTTVLDLNGDIEKIVLNDDVEMDINDHILIKTYSEHNTPDETGAYEIPVNLKNNPRSANIVYVDASNYYTHFSEIIQKNITLGSVDDWNDFESRFARGLVQLGVGRQIVQHEASLLPLMVTMSNPELDLVESTIKNQFEYMRFKNKFNTKMVSMYDENPSQFMSLPINTIVNDIINSINIGKGRDMAYWLDGVGSTADLLVTFIPPSPAYLGMTRAFKPQNNVIMHVGRDKGVYNIDHMGLVSKAYASINGVSKMDLVLLELENRIFNSIAIKFKNSDYVPLMVREMYAPSIYNATEYSFAEWNEINLRGFVNWCATNDVDYTLNQFDKNNWKTWNFHRSKYTISQLPVRGNWRGIFIDAYGTWRPHTHPWECFGFSQRPEWWDGQYKPSRIRVGRGDSDFMTVYEASYTNEAGNVVSNGLWDYNGTAGDLSTGTIRLGVRAGSYEMYRRFGVVPFTVVDTGSTAANGDIIYDVVLTSPADMGLIDGNMEGIEDRWTFGDFGDTEFAYYNTVLAPFDETMALFRAKPAQFANYFYATENSDLFQVSNTGKYQFLIAGTDRRCDITPNSLVHTERDLRVFGYQTWISDALKLQNIDVVTHYGDNVRRSDIQLGNKLGGFTKKEQLAFVSDNFGRVAEDSYDVSMVKSAVKSTAIMSALKIQYVGNGYLVSGYDLVNPYFTVLKPITSGKKVATSIGNTRVTLYSEYSDTEVRINYGTLFKTQQEVFTFIVSYGKALEHAGWIFDDQDQSGSYFDWTSIAEKFVDWSNGNLTRGEFVKLTPSSVSAKFVTEMGSVQSVTQYSGGVWSLLDSNGQGIRPYEIETSRIGNVFSVRIPEGNDIQMSLIRLNVIWYEHAVIFDNTTIFGDKIYIPEFGASQEMLRQYGYITNKWNGRLEADGFIVLEDGTLPNFEKLVNDFTKYYSDECPQTSPEICKLSGHLIGFQTRDWLRNLILNDASQMDFYRGYIREKGTKQVFEKVLRTSKSYQTDNYRVLEEWAIRVGEYGNVYGKKHLQFQLDNNEIKQEPQLFVFDENAKNADAPDGIVQYFGETGVDERWMSRPTGYITFPLLDTERATQFPSVGSVSLGEVDVVTKSYETLANDRRKFTAKTGKLPSTVWMLNNQNSIWDILDITKTTNELVSIEIVEDIDNLYGSHVILNLSQPHGLVDGDYFYFTDNSGYMPDELANEQVYYNTGLANTQISLSMDLSIDMTFDNPPVLMVFKSKFNDTYTREMYNQAKQSKKVIADSSMFDRSVIFNTVNDITTVRVNTFDPLNNVFPGIITNDIKYTTTINPALYNSDTGITDAWGREHVGEVWWDTTETYYLDYHVSILDSNGNVDQLATLRYKRENWGRLLPQSNIIVKEWVESPVAPYEWDAYVASQSKANKEPNKYYPSGVADVEQWSEHMVYDNNTHELRKMYYFWVSESIYVPNAMNREHTVSEIKQMIADPARTYSPWFAPVGRNAFVIGNLGNTINDNKEAITITYRTSTIEMNRHEQYQLCKEGSDYNFNPVVWDHLYDSLCGEMVLDDGSSMPLEYPEQTLGNRIGQTWFMDVLEARRAFTTSANRVYKSRNITVDQLLMSTVFLQDQKEKNPNEQQFKVVRYNNNNVLSVLEIDKFAENDPVLVFTNGDLPTPLKQTEVYYVHITPEGYLELMYSPSTDFGVVPIRIEDKGMGTHTIIKQSDYIANLGSAFNMEDYWTYTDWYDVGYSEFTSYVTETSLDSANSKNYMDGDVIRIVGSDGLWTLYVREYSRNTALWTAVGREKSTVELSSKLYDGYERFDEKGEPTPFELNVRKALRLLKESFEMVQSRVVFDMIKYVLTEQKIIDWAFKTTYIYIIGLEQPLQLKTAQRDNVLDDIIGYFDEVKPYRTKIRSQIEQKTSDEDYVNGVCNDLTPNGYVFIDGAAVKTQKDVFDYEYAKYNEYTQKWEIVGELPPDFTPPERMFQEMNVSLVFDNFSCRANVDFTDIPRLEAVNRRYMTQTRDVHTDAEAYKLQRFEFTTPTPVSVDEIGQGVQNILSDEYDWYNLAPTIDEGLAGAYQHIGNDLVLLEQFNDSVDAAYETTIASNTKAVELQDYTDYNTLINRLKMYTGKPDDALSIDVDCGFKGIVLSDNPATRISFGYSGDTDDSYGYGLVSSDLYQKMREIAIAEVGDDTDKVNARLKHKYGVYAFNTNKQDDYDDIIYVLSAMRNIHKPTEADPYGDAKAIIERIKSSDIPAIVMIPRSMVYVYNIDEPTVVDSIPEDIAIKTYIEMKFMDGYEMWEVAELSLNDLPVDSTNPMYTEIMDVVTNTMGNTFVDDIHGYDNTGYDATTTDIVLESTGVASTQNDPVFVDISTINPSGIVLSKMKFTVTGYGYDTTGNDQIRNQGNFSIEGKVILNPYNSREVIVSIPHYDEAMAELTGVVGREPIKYMNSIDAIVSARSFISKGHKLRKGDKVAVLTNAARSVVMQQQDGSEKTIIDVATISANARPILFTVSSVQKDKVTLVESVFANNYAPHDQSNPYATPIPATVMRVTSFNDDEFVGDDAGTIVRKYTNDRMYRVSLYDYSISYDRYISEGDFSPVDYDTLDAWYVSNEISYDENGNPVTNGFYMPSHAKGSLSERVRMGVEEFVKITVYDYDPAVIKPTLVNGVWTYAQPLVDGMYIDTVEPKATVIVDASDMLGAFVSNNFVVGQVSVDSDRKITSSVNMKNHSIAIAKGEVIEYLNGYALRGVHYSTREDLSVATDSFVIPDMNRSYDAGDYSKVITNEFIGNGVPVTISQFIK